MREKGPMLRLRARPGSPLPAIAVAFLVLPAAGGSAAAQEPAAAGARSLRAEPTTADELMERLGDAWFARDFAGYLALWDFGSPGQGDAEADAAREAFASDETQLTVLGGPRAVAGVSGMVADVRVFIATEPRARVENWRLSIERRGPRMAFVAKAHGQSLEGLVHLPLGDEAWRVQDVPLRLEDFELQMESGTLFSTPEAVGPTALVFVGRARVRFSPRPEAEREQLRQFGGRPQLDRGVEWAFIRVDPGHLGTIIDTSRLEPEPAPERRRREAERRWAERSPRSYLVDAALPRSPWWLYPSRGDALVEFPWKHGRVLTFVVSEQQEENLTLFDRDRNLRICSYRSADRPPRRSGGHGEAVDVLHHDLRVRFEPSRFMVSAIDTLSLRLLAPVSVIRLKLDDDLRVSSVSSQDGDDLLFLRVRGQNGIVVSLGPQAGRFDELHLTVRYSGRHEPGPIEQEALQVFPEPGHGTVPLLIAPPLVYSNRTAWYPRPQQEDFATLRARFDTPEDFVAVTGGEQVSSRVDGGRRLAEYRLREPGKYFTAIVGRFEDVGTLRSERRVIHGYAAPQTARQTRDRMSTAVEMLSFYEELFGPCPHSFISQVSAEALSPGGHSPPGLVYVQRRPPLLLGRPLPEDPANFSDVSGFFLAHELAHQWWGQGVAPASYRDQWLSEGWAQYSAALWVRRQRGDEAFDNVMERMARWARRHDEDGPIDLGRRLGHLKHDQRIQRAIVYDKGAWILHMLRGIVGDGAFFQGARAFLDEHRYARVTSEDLRAALETTSGRDLEPYFQRWIYGTGLPALRWTSQTRRTPDGYQTTVRLQPQGLPGPLPLEIGLETGTDRVARRVLLEPSGGSWTITTSDDVRAVRIDEGRSILAETKRVRSLPRPAQR